MNRTTFCLFLFSCLIAAVGAQPPPPPPPVNHEFDFWLGEWTVTTPDGKPAGKSRVEAIAGGHALLENWLGDPTAGGGDGKSLNAYNPAKKQWQQFWVGSGGVVLELAGGIDAQGRMTLAGTRLARDGHAVLNRITWTPHRDGTVQQLWETSVDAGKTWQTAFDGLYRRN